ncbi:putative FMN-binding split barrel [Helianthus annuus]|nr:putative FMN-binding split barrel [Helianthus annuus]
MYFYFLLTAYIIYVTTVLKFCSTIEDDLGGAPFGNVVSFSDGLPDKGTGVTYF